MDLGELGDLNWLAVLAGAAAWWVLGAIWYSPVLFGKRWQALSGVDPQASGGNQAALFIGTLVLNVVATAVLSTLAGAAEAETVTDGIMLGLLAGLGLATVPLVVTAMYENRPLALTAINAGYQFFGIVLASVIVTIMD